VATKHFYNLGYRFFRMPWEIGPRGELVELVTSGRLKPGRAVDLGCGTGANAVFLARQGFDVTGIDFAPAGLAKTVKAAEAAGVSVEVVCADLTALDPDLGPFDLLVDYGTFDDLSDVDRARYVKSVSRLAHPGSEFLLWCFEWPLRRRDRWTGMRTIEPGEVQRRFGAQWDFERLGGSQRPDMRKFIAGSAYYLGRRK
jgi:SAM-dependent methyltransferase